jgi:hypothetical protein
MSEHTYSSRNEDKDVPLPRRRARNRHKELPYVIWALQTNINRATRDTPFNLVYGVDVVVPL